MNPDRDTLIEQNLQLCKIVAGIATRNVPTGRRHCFEDVEATCRLLLVEAAEKFEPARGVPFDRFAKKYMLWKVYDEAGLRRKGLRESDHFSLAVLSNPSTPPNQEAEFEARETERRVGAAVKQLPRRARALLRHQFVHGKKNREIGKVLDMSPEGVRQARNRAIKSLRTLIDAA